MIRITHSKAQIFSEKRKDIDYYIYICPFGQYFSVPDVRNRILTSSPTYTASLRLSLCNKERRATLSSFYAFLKITIISVPLPSSLATKISALWIATICFTMASPNPVPPFFLERLLSTR